MKKHFNKILAGLMVGVSAVTMTACGGAIEDVGATNGSEQKVPMGRYMEESIELPGDMKQIVGYLVGVNGDMTLYGYNQEGKVAGYSRALGQDWESKDVAWLQKLFDEKNYVYDMITGDDGQNYVVYANEQMEYKLGKINENDTLEELSFVFDQANGMPSKVHILENEDIIVSSYMSGITKYSGTDGSRLIEYAGSGGEFVVAGDQVGVTDYQRGGIIFYNLATGKEESFVAYDGLEMGCKLVADQEGNSYIINNTGVNRLAKGGSTWENIIEAGMSAFGTPSLGIMKASISGEEFQVFFYDQVNGYELINYKYNPDIPSRPTTEVSVYMLEDNMTIRQAAAEYQRQNPEVMVHLQIGMKSGEATTKSDAIRTLNTELLAGKGPDILILDGLPIDSYIDKGVLLDMNEFVGPMIDAKMLLSNIMAPYKEDDKIYALPTTFELPMMWGDQELLKDVSSVEDIAEWAKAHPDKQVMYHMPPSMVMRQFYGASAKSWLDENGQIKEAEFAKFLEAIKLLSDEEAPEITNDEAYYAIRHYGAEYMAYSDTELHIDSIKGFLNMMIPYSAVNQRGDGDFKVMESGGQGVYEAKGIVGINANSKNSELAKGIIEVALSESVQGIDLGEGFAVNTAAFNKQSEFGSSGTFMAMSVAQSDDRRPIEFVQPDQAAYEKVANQAKSVSVPAYEDEVLLEMIIEETKGYFDGTKTAEEAASAVAQRTKAYLAE